MSSSCWELVTLVLYEKWRIPCIHSGSHTVADVSPLLSEENGSEARSCRDPGAAQAGLRSAVALGCNSGSVTHLLWQRLRPDDLSRPPSSMVVET